MNASPSIRSRLRKYALSSFIIAAAVLGAVNASAQSGGLLSVQIAGSGLGGITSDDGNINCPGDCSQSYFTDQSVTLTASADADGSVFVGWSGGCSEINGNICIVDMSGNRNVDAVFDNSAVEGGFLSVDLLGTGSGSVTSDDGNISCLPDCGQSYTTETTVTLRPSAATGSTFSGWGGACSGLGGCTVTMSVSRNVTASFTSDAVTEAVLSVTTEGDGVVSSSPAGISCPEDCSETYTDNETVVLTANPGQGQFFIGWSGDCSGNAGCTVVMSGNRNVGALFDSVNPDPDVLLSVELAGTGSGTVGSNDQGIACPDDCNQTYPADTTVTLNATAADGSTFAGWQGGGCSGTGSCIVTLAENLTVTALFDVPPQPQEATLNVVTDGSGTGKVQSNDEAIDCPENCSQSYDIGELVTLTATAGSGSLFAGWQGAGCSGTGSCEVNMSADRRVTALFQLDGDSDNDLVPNSIDQCPNTPAGETVDEVGCSVTQPRPEDDDRDGVANTIDQCPNTPPGEAVDEVGCSRNQEPQDDDIDGVTNTLDQCPNTPQGESVDEVGCSAAEQPEDDDGDGVTNKEDFCANTAPGAGVDATGCSTGQNDADGDGVVDAADACPATPSYVAAVDSEGCPAIVQFGNQLGELQGLGFNEQRLGTRLDEICPMLVKLDDSRHLTAGEEDLRKACLRLKNTDTTLDQASFALREISVTELASQKNYAVDIATSQYRHVGNRMNQVKSGGGQGVSVTGLNLDIDGQMIPGHVIQSAVEGLLGMGASGDSFADFGKLGLFIQGDLDFGDRDETELESGYDFDSWTISLGADYRFSDTVFAGISASLGDVEVDYDLNGGSTDISNWTLSAYSGWSVTENFYVDGLISYGESDIESIRNIGYVDSGGDFDSSHNGDTDGEQLFIGINTGYVLNRGSWRFGPTASLAYLDGSIDKFTETSRGAASQAWNFDIDGQSYESLRLSLGAQADYIFNTSFGVLIPGIRVAYVLEQEDDSDEISMRLVNNPFTEGELSSDQIVVRTDGQDSGYLDASFNLSGQFIMGFSGFVSYQFYTGFDDYSRQGFTFGARWDKPF